MNPITDDDLVLYHYRDGLDPDRIAQITAALATSQALRERYVAIERAVAVAIPFHHQRLVDSCAVSVAGQCPAFTVEFQEDLCRIVEVPRHYTGDIFLDPPSEGIVFVADACAGGS